MFKYIITALLFFATSCTNDKKRPDVSHIKIEVPIERFEQAFFKLDTLSLPQGLQNLRNTFPSFYPVFMQNILQLPGQDTNSYKMISNIVSAYRPIHDSIQVKYRNLNWFQSELKKAFRFVKYYYPQYRLPKIITFIGTLDAPGAILTPDYLGIGLHQFAGKNFSVYNDPQVQQLYPFYISRRFDKEFMTTNALKAIGDDIFPDQSIGKPLIEQMIEKGKSLYLLDHFLPDVADTIKTGYTQKQLDWAEENEGNVWAYITKNENIYSIEPHVIQTYIGESPFTQGMPETSPGNIGQWIGWRMVQKFAGLHEDVSLQQILATPSKKIFEESKYRPK